MSRLTTCSDHKPTIDVLDRHVIIIVSKHKIGGDKFRNVELVDKSDFDEVYFDGNWTDVARAYGRF